MERRPQSKPRSRLTQRRLDSSRVARLLPLATWIALIAPLATPAVPPLDAVPTGFPARGAAPRYATETTSSTKHWVYFRDKGTLSPVDREQRRAAVRSALDPHAVARRLKTFGAELIDDHDLPIEPRYRAALDRLGAEVLWESRWLNALSVRAPAAVLEQVAALDFVRRIEPVRRGRRPDTLRREPQPGAPRDPSAPRMPAASDPVPWPGSRDLYDYGPSRDQLDEIGIVAAHETGLSGAGVRIALMDTGYWRDHEIFARLLSEGRLIDQWDFINNDGETMDEPGDPEGQHNHGTTVWSLVGGFVESELIGSAYGADFLLCKTEDVSMEDPVEEDNWVAAMEWSDARGADIISSSLNYIQWYTYEDMDGNTAPITIASDIAAGRGIVVCTAAGNWGTQDWYYIGAPADADSVVAVGGTEPSGQMWLDSSHGPTYDGRTKPEVCARGAYTYVARVPGGHGGPDLYYHTDGTSVACPLVAGAAALLLEAHPHWPAMLVREALMMTADNAQTPDNHRGWGRIDAMAALQYGATGIAGVLPATEGGLSAAPNPFVTNTHLALDPALRAQAGPVLDVFSPAGELVRSLRVAGVQTHAAWDGRDGRGRQLPPGAYFARLRGRGSGYTTKVILIR